MQIFMQVRLVIIILAIVVASAGVTAVSAAPHVALDLDTGKVISRQQAFDPWHPASLTKLMTAYSIFNAIRAGEIYGNTMVRISKIARAQPSSRMGYRTGTTMTLDNALKLLVVKSANDIAIAIAESLSGSVDRFVNRMNSDAASLGMSGSRFVNPHGLHNRQQVTTARDMALLIRAIHRDFPQYRDLFSNPSVSCAQ